ncbi:thiol S-methyltransferase TMT1A-like isoform X1 [Tachypleus tridentatus]|uniref:thiol S-methyltransferase TMT1A-like isoform X1 n=1 Tax=Tachypleus tridentatus TaxID=6853 RepID=UPI003FCEFA13
MVGVTMTSFALKTVKAIMCYMMLPIMTFLIFLFFVLKYNTYLRTRWFAWFHSNIWNPVAEIFMFEMKREHFKGLQTIVSHDPDLRKEETIRILEIGAAHGCNLEFYPNNSRFIGVDPNPHFSFYFHKAHNLKKNRHVVVEQLLCCGAEDMKDIPDNSVDTVTSTYVMCSVTSIQETLKEILRVLTPGGKYYFFEHVVFPKETWRKMIQEKFEPIWTVFFAGCKITRSPVSYIDRAGFSHVTYETSYPLFVPIVCRPHLVGVATK